MRVAVGKALRVGPGDEVFVRGQLIPDAKLGRLFVFAKSGTAEFSPYVLNVAEQLMVVGDRPIMMTPLSMRLNDRSREKELSFVADIDGVIRVMQEVDSKTEPTAKVTLSRRICQSLPWRQKLKRKLSGILPWSS